MRIGAMNHPVRPLLREIEVLAGLGFDLLELAMDPPCAHHGQVRQQSRAVARSLEKYGLALVCHLPTFVYPADLTESIRRASIAELLDAATVAAGLGAGKVVLHPPPVNGLGPQVPELSGRYVEQALRQVLEHCFRLELVVCLENMFPVYGGFWLPEHFAAWLEEYPGLRLTLDAGHANIGRGSAGAMAFVRRFGPRIGHLHLSDNDGRRDRHLPLGEGTVDFRSLAAATAGLDPDLTVTLEVFSDDRSLLQASRARWKALLAGG